MTETTSPQAPAAPRYAVVSGDVVRDKSQTLSIWRDGGFVEHGAGDGARFDWFYAGSPAGNGQLNLLMAGADLAVGSLGVCPRQFVVDGKALLAGVLVDFVVHPAHRTALPALQLQRAARARASESMDILYGLPDTKAIPIFKRLGHQVSFGLPAYARVLRAAPYLKRLLPAWLAQPTGFFLDKLDGGVLRLRVLVQRIFNADNRGKRGAWTNDFDPSFDALWSDFPKQDLCVGVRNAEFLRWRFGQRPGFSYRTFAIRSAASGRLHAYFVCDVTADSASIKDCLCLGDRDEWVFALNLLILQVRREGVQALYVHLEAPAHVKAALRSAGFRQRSVRPFFAATKENVMPSNQVWYLSQADEDV